VLKKPSLYSDSRVVCTVCQLMVLVVSVLAIGKNLTAVVQQAEVD